MQLENISNKILTIRNQQVMLDKDLARLYQIPTKQLNQAVKRNKGRFPEDFCFKLKKYEFDELLRSQFVTSNLTHGGRRYFPYVFTEEGVAMLSGILKTKIAVKVNIKIMRAFVAMRHFLIQNANIFQRLDRTEY